MSEKTQILFLYIYWSSFVEKDYQILKKKYNVILVKYRTLIDIFGSIQILKKVKAVFCWFGSVRFLPLMILGKISGKKIIVVSGGYDVANVPELRYGNMNKKYKAGIPRILGRLLFKIADRILCVSDSNFQETINNAKVPKQNTVIIKHGFYDIPEDVKKRLNENCKEDMVITAGIIDSCTLQRKGLLQMAKLSKYFPKVPFVFIGESEEETLKILKAEAGENAIFTGFLENYRMFDYFLKAKIYMQLSLHEAFGCSVAESMLFNCIPIVSDKYALPEVVGNAGFCINPQSDEEAVEVIAKVLKGELHPKENPRDRILREFPIERRAEKLLSIMNDLLGK